MSVAHTIPGLPLDAGVAIARQFDTICRSMLRGPDTTIAPGVLLYITHEPHPFGNFACVSDPSDSSQARTAIVPLMRIAAPSAIVFPDFPSSEVDGLLKASGFTLGEAMPAMAVQIDCIAATSLPEGYQFMELTTSDQDAAWCAAFAAGYGIPLRTATDFGLRAAKRHLNHGEVRYFCITHDNDVVTTSTLYLEGGLAGIYCVSTLPSHRGKGLAAFATAEPLRLARSLNHRIGILQSSAMGESVYRRLGFQSFGTMAMYVRIPEGSSSLH